MNWIDIVLLLILGAAAVKGFFRGFIVEVCTLLGLVIGIWAGVHLNERAAQWMGLDPDQAVISFIVVFLAVLVGAHLIGKGLTKVIDVAQLGLPNKLAGVLFGALRSAFVLSVVLNILFAKEAAAWTPNKETREGSVLYEPLRAFAPLILPALGETKWVRKAIDEVEREVTDAVDH